MLITKVPRELETFCLENIGILFSFERHLPHSDTYSRSREIAILEKVKKNLTSNISEIHGPIILPKELDR